MEFALFYITIVPMLPVLPRGAAKLLPEGFSEITAGTKTAAVGDLGNGKVCLSEKLAGLLQAVISDVGQRCHAQIVLKEPEAYPFADIHGSGKLIYGKGLG